ncbi:hypothetical protein tb265_32290 [Gemmatimonadetes bacterium T265]|nr:hypothetical protein tb265_32290 [Gemmatimonadetes bacterium T265]
MQAPRSLQHEYRQYLDLEIEAYKDSLSHTALLALGDEAVATLRTMSQTSLDEVVLCEEVNRIIARRRKLPTYRTWRRRYMKRIAELRQPERWGFAAEGTLVRELVASRDGEHVLVAGLDGEDAIMFSAALGCAVTTVGHEPEVVGRTLAVAEASGLGNRVRACVGDLDAWMPDAGLRVVLCSTVALGRVDVEARPEVIDALQRATLPGGTHFVRAPGGTPSGEAHAAWVRELTPQYVGWTTTVEDCGRDRPTFIAHKLAR